MGRSTITLAYLESPVTSVKYTIRDTEFEGAFFLADGIHPNYAFHMKTISELASAREKIFAKCQEGCTKDVERAFGRLGYYPSDIFWTVLPDLDFSPTLRKCGGHVFSYTT